MGEEILENRDFFRKFAACVNVDEALRQLLENEKRKIFFGWKENFSI